MGTDREMIKPDYMGRDVIKLEYMDKADEGFMKRMRRLTNPDVGLIDKSLWYEGKDGGFYPTMKSLEIANIAWEERRRRLSIDFGPSVNLSIKLK